MFMCASVQLSRSIFKKTKNRKFKNVYPFVCICVNMYIRIYVNMHICTHVSINTCIPASMYAFKGNKRN